MISKKTGNGNDKKSGEIKSMALAIFFLIMVAVCYAMCRYIGFTAVQAAVFSGTIASAASLFIAKVFLSRAKRKY